MPAFLDTLVVSPLSDGYTWYLDRLYRFDSALPPAGVISVPPRFETDFASVPSPFWMIFPKWGTYGPAAVVHDWLYWVQTPHTRPESDAVFREAMVTLQVRPWKRWVLYHAVRWFGWVAWRENAKLRAQGVTRMNTGGTAPTWKRWSLVPRRRWA